MYKILLLDDRTQFQLLYSINLEFYADGQMHIESSLEKAIQFLQNSPGLQLIVCRQMMKGKKVAVELQRFLKENNLFIPLVVLGKERLLEDHAVLLEERPKLKDLIQVTAKALGITAQEMAQKTYDQFIPLSVKYFLFLKDVEQEIYIKVEDQGKESYEVLYPPSSPIDRQIIEETLDSNIQSFYVKCQDRLKFVNAFSTAMLALLQEEDLNKNEKLTLVDAAMNLISDQLLEIGLTEETINLAKGCIKKATELTELSPKIGKILKELLSNRLSYRYKHSQLIIIFSCHIIKNLEWGSKEQFDKIAFVSFYHDLPLPSDNLAKIHSEEELTEANLNDKDRNLVLEHALISANYVRKVPRAPIGSDVIIEQHHGAKSGYGFTKNMVSVSPLAMVFLVAEECSRLVLESHEKKEKLNKGILISHLQERFPSNTYRKFIKNLENLKF